MNNFSAALLSLLLLNSISLSSESSPYGTIPWSVTVGNLLLTNVPQYQIFDDELITYSSYFSTGYLGFGFGVRPKTSLMLLFTVTQVQAFYYENHELEDVTLIRKSWGVKLTRDISKHWDIGFGMIVLPYTPHFFEAREFATTSKEPRFFASLGLRTVRNKIFDYKFSVQGYLPPFLPEDKEFIATQSHVSFELCIIFNKNKWWDN